MTPQRAVVLFVAAVGLLGCRDTAADPRAISVTETDSAGITLVSISGAPETLPLWVISDEPILEVKGEDPPFLSSIGEVELLEDGSVVVEDNQSDELRIFDADGESFRTIGGPGEGPGEFRNLTELSLTPGDTIVAFDRRNYRISIFSPAGEFLRSVPVEREVEGPRTYIMDAWAFSSDRFLLHSVVDVDSANTEPRPRLNHNDAVLLELVPEGTITNRLAQFSGGYSVQFEGGGGSSPFAPRPIIDMNSGRFGFSSGEDYRLTLAAGPPGILRVITWSGWKQPLADELVASVRSDFDAGWEEVREVDPQLVDNIMRATFAPELLPDSLPVLRSVIPLQNGRTWVCRFRPTNEAWMEEDSWHLLNPQGHPVARLALPPESKLVAARGDHVVLVTRDSMDLETLRVFRVLESTS